MGDSARNCKREAGIAAMESSRRFLKKRKAGFGFNQLNLCSLNFQLRDFGCIMLYPENNVSLATSSNSSGVLSGDFCFVDSASSCGYRNGTRDVEKHNLPFADLEAKSSETECSTCINKKSSKTTPSGEFSGDTDDMNSPAEAPDTCRRNSLSVHIETEIDEFFEAAKEKEHKRLSEKYNYDFVNDVPLEGRYEWVHLKP